MKVSTIAGKITDPSHWVNIPKLITAYYSGKPDPFIPAQRISFGTSGHRGSSFENSFNEDHILAITQAICYYRKQEKIQGPLYIGSDTHALSVPAFASALEVLAANGVEAFISEKDEYTPTPVISHAIVTYNIGRSSGFADGIVITPSHNPPHEGGFKYNPPNGGAAGTSVTKWVENKANELLKNKLADVKRIILEKAIKSSTTHRFDFLQSYIPDLENVLDMEAIRRSGVHIGVDPMGGAGVNYWGAIAAHYNLNLQVINKIVDPTFSFMTADWDGQIRMDPSSAYAMQRLLEQKNRFEICVACDTDHDRHGIVTRNKGLMKPNNFLSVAVYYLLQQRPKWNSQAVIGKTVVSSSLIDKVTADAGRKLYETPVGFKWYAEGLNNGSLCFACEESAGATFSRKNGKAWTTDKDGIVPALLAAEIKANTGRDPEELLHFLTEKHGESFYERVEVPTNSTQKEKLSKLSSNDISAHEIAGEKIIRVLTEAPGNNEAIGGIKVITENGWFAARPSGTESIYKIYAESFLGADHLKSILDNAQVIVNNCLSGTTKTTININTPAEQNNA
jgi:phosphoglucomutase